MKWYSDEEQEQFLKEYKGFVWKNKPNEHLNKKFYCIQCKPEIMLKNRAEVIGHHLKHLLNELRSFVDTLDEKPKKKTKINYKSKRIEKI